MGECWLNPIHALNKPHGTQWSSALNDLVSILVAVHSSGAWFDSLGIAYNDIVTGEFNYAQYAPFIDLVRILFSKSPGLMLCILKSYKKVVLVTCYDENLH